MRRLTAVAAVAVALDVFLFQTGRTSAELIQIVSPAAWANTEGPGGVNQQNPQDRYQQVYPASDFSLLPNGGGVITQFAYRPNGAITTPLQGSFAAISVRLSTTSANPGSLSMTFADNIGPDETLVLSATDYFVSTQNLGPAGGPKEFDILYTLQTPFEYDPSEGNLLMDFSFTWGTGDISVDGAGAENAGPQGQMIGGLGETATYSVGGVITRFTVVPEPSTSTLFSVFGLVGAFVAWRKRKRT